MSFTTKPSELTDEQLDRIAQDAALTQAALAERERRIEAKREAEQEEARQKVAAEKQATVDGLLRKHDEAAEDAQREAADLGEAIVIAGGVLERRDTALCEVFRFRAALKDLGVQSPPFDLSFSPEAKAAGRRLVPFFDREMVESPIASAERLNPNAFRR